MEEIREIYVFLNYNSSPYSSLERGVYEDQFLLQVSPEFQEFFHVFFFMKTDMKNHLN